jgi:hypothetical protein
MQHILGLFFLVGAAVWLVVNASFMLASPRAWFRLPRWLGLHGSLTEARYGSGWGAIQTRMAGALMLSVVVWVVFDSAHKAKGGATSKILGQGPGVWGPMLLSLACVIAAVTGLQMVINALFMLAAPRAWLRLPSWLRAKGFWFEKSLANGGGTIETRLTGASILAVVVWILYEWLKKR